MVGPTNGSRTRQAFSVVNGGQDLAPANGLASNVGSDCGSVEFTREEVEGLLAFSVVNGGQDLAPANGLASNVGSDCGSVEFTREEVEGLLNEKMKTKNEFNLKEKFDQMMKYIKRLRLCIKWLQEFEGSYLLEQEKLRNLLEMAEKKCSDMEMLIKAKEEELNSIIIELRKTYSSLQEKFMKEESGRLVRLLEELH
ncbi:hypothetical protein CsSME_00020931 [Camellia sinensis var. sinensis]